VAYHQNHKGEHYRAKAQDGFKRPENIWEFAEQNNIKFEGGQQALSECDMAMRVIGQLNEPEQFTPSKLVLLFMVGSKSAAIQRDRLFWHMMSNLALQEGLVSPSAKLKTLANVASCVSRLPSLDMVTE
jgi:uncharacterized protein YggL (DUF469 family)